MIFDISTANGGGLPFENCPESDISLNSVISLKSVQFH